MKYNSRDYSATGMATGGPPLISFEDFDIEPPGNFNDDQLVSNDTVPKLDDDLILS
jgi:hypothetical protein